ncbi:DUF485 domain-containing protein [Corynebacterium choanae]|uniref:DUF485 domain-containing protein n=1 Tax=Corynebacterium choanae TaxID=1862358 RepID=A0A3G6J5K5_9CORY|nr:DUF485 domain-containing protein [Corynebacterium choanae]AZA13043.1 hypothetical protein CCHOA_03150 [Corynebacterium choanae]
MSAAPPPGVRRRQPTAAEFREMQHDPEFLDLKKSFRSFVFPMSIAFFLWYVLYILLAIYATDFMSKPLFGHVNVALIMGVLQFVTTFAITAIYIRFANASIEPKSTAIRTRMEG